MVVVDALEAIRRCDWDALRPLLHPYLHWSVGGVRIRGRVKVLDHLAVAGLPAQPGSYELRDGQIYRWTGELAAQP
jgi:hypothetical protein